MPRHQGIRCHGFTSGPWCHCSREEHAGKLDQSRSGTYGHRIECRCAERCTCSDRGRRKPGCWCADGCRCCRCGLVHADRCRNRAQLPSNAGDDVGRAWAIHSARGIFASSRTLAGTLGERYLRTRGITIAPAGDELRFHAALRYCKGGPIFPAVVAPFRDVHGRLVGIERIFLATNGSAKVPLDPAKKMLGSVRGAAIRFGGVEEFIGLTEGLENALSVRQATGRPVWAAGALGFLSTIALPESVRKVVVFADPKPQEIHGAEEAVRRLIAEGRHARVAYPAAGLDANDMLRRV